MRGVSTLKTPLQSPRGFPLPASASEDLSRLAPFDETVHLRAGMRSAFQEPLWAEQSPSSCMLRAQILWAQDSWEGRPQRLRLTGFLEAWVMTYIPR